MTALEESSSSRPATRPVKFFRACRFHEAHWYTWRRIMERRIPAADPSIRLSMIVPSNRFESVRRVYLHAGDHSSVGRPPDWSRCGWRAAACPRGENEPAAASLQPPRGPTSNAANGRHAPGFMHRPILKPRCGDVPTRGPMASYRHWYARVSIPYRPERHTQVRRMESR